MQAIVIAEDAEEKDNLSYVLRKAGLAVASSSDLTRVLAKWSDHPADLDLEELHLDPSTRSVTVSGQERRLTQLEFRLLYVLMTHRGQVIPTEVLVERIWGYTGEGSRELVRGLVSRLRHKIGDSPDQPGLLETLPGEGGRFG